MQVPVGRVYVLTNPSMPGVVKIGFTMGTVEGRAKELDSTGLPKPFEVAYQVEVRGADALERQAHSKLSANRVRNSREFFEIDVFDAIECVRGLATEPMGEECHPKYVQMIGLSAKQRAEEIEKQKLAKTQAEQNDRIARFDSFIQENATYQKELGRLRLELENLKEKIQVSPQLIKLTWYERNALGPLVFAITLCLCGLGAAYVSNDFKIASACAAAVGALWFLFRSLKGTIRYKELDNRPLVAMDVERRNLEYDIEKLESQKKYLSADLADLATANPIQSNDKGFEGAAKKIGRVS